MRPAHIAAMLAAGAMASVGAGAPPEPVVIRVNTDRGYMKPVRKTRIEDAIQFLPVKGEPLKLRGRMGLNQRQIRKNRRRLHAAGSKKAFI